jgi:hypothetical protein
MPRVAIYALLALATPAHAEPRDSFDRSYLHDGGALPFFWAPLALGIGVQTLLSPREIPFGFTEEGGEVAASWEIPSWALFGIGVAAGGAILASGDDSRYYHVKGISQAMATSMFVTSVGKTVFGRRRPDWSKDRNTRSSRRAFPSGHATQAFAVAAYSILFLRGHVLGDDPGYWQGAAYGSIALGATLLAAERVYHKRHYVTDVVVGGLVGTAASLVFYHYQQDRFDDARDSTPSARRAPALTWTTVW